MCFCPPEIRQKFLIYKRKRGRITDIIECYYYREIDNKGVNNYGKRKEES